MDHHNLDISLAGDREEEEEEVSGISDNVMAVMKAQQGLIEQLQKKNKDLVKKVKVLEQRDREKSQRIEELLRGQSREEKEVDQAKNLNLVVPSGMGDEQKDEENGTNSSMGATESSGALVPYYGKTGGFSNLLVGNGSGQSGESPASPASTADFDEPVVKKARRKRIQGVQEESLGKGKAAEASIANGQERSGGGGTTREPLEHKQFTCATCGRNDFKSFKSLMYHQLGTPNSC